MARKGAFKCGRCKRTFKMAAHLARHMAAGHGVKKTGNRTIAHRTTGFRAKLGRPVGIVARLGLRELGLEQLTEVISAARFEARRKLAELESALQ